MSREIVSLPRFYIQNISSPQHQVFLDEDTSKHIVQVLRMKVGEQVLLTSGVGDTFTAVIANNHRKHCAVDIVSFESNPGNKRKITIAVSLLKNTSRFEWLLEKLTEIGVDQIVPLICNRTEKQKFRADRMKQILVSAMLQSQQSWLPTMHHPITFAQLFADAQIMNSSQKFIAHCLPERKRNLADLVNESLPSQMILIGPEGDFTSEEIEMATNYHFDAVSLGETRLRTETAGIVAVTLMRCC